MKSQKGTTYRDVGVLSNKEFGLEELLKWTRPTEEFRAGKERGKSIVPPGFFAAVIEFGPGLGLALCTDGVGTKIIIAESLGNYETIGIDCVAMNVNDIICVGAEPVSMVDYLAVSNPNRAFVEAVGRGLHEGARQAGINIVGGEVAQIKELLSAERDQAFDLVGLCVGFVPTDKIILGREVKPGDVVVGLRSSGIHCNGLTLARKALFEQGNLEANSYVPELGRTVGEELLEPTHIYVPEIMEMLSKDIPIKGLVNITSDGFLNLTRIDSKVGFEIDRLPPALPVFELIQRMGGIEDAEMYYVFNMGVGFCIIAPDDPKTLASIHSISRKHDLDSFEIGRVVEDPDRKVEIREKNLTGKGDRFYPSNQGVPRRVAR